MEVYVDIPKVEADVLLGNALNMIYFIVGVVAIAMIIFGGVLYTTSAGDAKKVETAKKTITYSVIGLVVVILAFVITRFVLGVF